MKMSGKIEELCRDRKVKEFYFSYTQSIRYFVRGFWIFKKMEQIVTYNNYFCVTFDDDSFELLKESEIINATNDTLHIVDTDGNLSSVTVEAGDPYSMWRKLIDSILMASDKDPLLSPLKSSNFVKNLI